MARYRNVNSGAVVSVREDKVLGTEWEPAEKPAPAKRTTKKADAKSADDES